MSCGSDICQWQAATAWTNQNVVFRALPSGSCSNGYPVKVGLGWQQGTLVACSHQPLHIALHQALISANLGPIVKEVDGGPEF